MEEKNIKEEIRELTAAVKQSLDQQKPKKFRSIKTVLGKKKMRKGYVLVSEIKENRVVNIRKEPIIDGTIKLDDTYHAIGDLDIFFYQPIIGKLKPMIFQAKNRLNPWNPLEEKKETYGQKHIIARMERDQIKDKKSFGIGIWLIVILIIAGVAYYFLSGGKLA